MNKHWNIHVDGHSGLASPAMARKLRVLTQHWGYLIKSVLIGEQVLAQLKNRSLYLMLLIEASIFAMAYTAAYLLRFEFTLTPRNFGQIMLVLPWLIPLKLAVFSAFGLYKGMWRYSSLHDFWRLAQGCLLSTVLVVETVFFVYGFDGFSRAVFLLDGLLTFIMTGGVRMAIRTYYAFKNSSNGESVWPLRRFKPKPRDRKRILIVGAGRSGEKILREIFDNPTIDFKVVGFLDDDPGKIGRALHGVPVLGSVDLLPEVHGKNGVDQVFISTPSASGTQMRRIIDICERCRVTFKTLPGIGQILDGQVSIKALRDVNYEDLLRRPPAHQNAPGILDYVKNRTIMVTGAGGSIGSELCRHLIRFDPERIILVDAGEGNLYSIKMELRHQLNFDAFHAILASVQNQRLMEEVFRNYRPDVVFHAAAYKHVPMLERNPWEAVFNNVLGSRVLMQLAEKYETKRFVLVSTDKAVRPTNVMGTSKRIAELILQSMQNGGTRFMAVRLGNVLASCGSVVPLFRKQIELGGPVTVTHPEITRYFMTIPEAAQLILQAGAIGNGGELFVLEMGTPVKIADMAADLIRLSGKEPGRDIEVIFTGLRPGEKLYEELITEGEDVTRTCHEKIMTLRYNGHWNWGGLSSQDNFRNWLDREIEELYSVGETHDACAIKQKLKQMVPEYSPQETESVVAAHPSFME
jgi:FlaA1/EpsC-like NDP-sugar epimerase